VCALALIVARRVGRARETLPVVLGTMVSQTLLNLLALTILA
jgi:phosphatidylinositol alpha-mannosyltransferase